MKNKIIFPLLAAIPLALSGCATDAHYVKTGDKEQIINPGQINIQDYANAANAALQDMLNPPNNAPCVLDRVANPPAVLFVSRIVNSTGQQIETDLLTQKITKALLDSGKAVITTTDPAAKGYTQENQFLNDQQNIRLPDFTLSGKIIETVDRAGNTSRHTYSFHLSLNDTKTGYQVWQGDKEIGKQGTRPVVGP